MRQSKKTVRKSNPAIDKMKETARKELKAIRDIENERAFLYMLAIPLTILVEDYWHGDDAKEQVSDFIEDVVKMYEAVLEGRYITDVDLAETLKERAGIELEAEWLKYRRKKNVDNR